MKLIVGKFSRHKKVMILLLISATLLFSGCGGDDEYSRRNDGVQVKEQGAVAPSGSDQTWVTDEILLQLKSMRSELELVKDSLVKLSDDVSKLRGARGGGAAQLATVDLAGFPFLGKNSAKVVIMEFSDFECPFCARHHQQVFGKIKQDYIDSGKIKYFSRQYPLPFHANAKGAAVAALCAGKQDQGKYWQMRDAIFASKTGLNAALYESAAKDMGLNIKKFTACSTDKTMGALVDADISYGESIGVSGTPKFFVGRIEDGKLTNVSVLDGAQPYTAFASVLDKKLAM